ncbi:MAG: hypothetical protein MK101_04850 [Phycisphaerales bacterium]|nr:hypothetical protein [Phycisphaerales bacterium]
MPTEKTIRPLGFWEATTALSSRRYMGGGTMVIMAAGRGPLDEQTAVEAARRLFQRHQILRCRFSAAEDVPDFIEDVRFEDIPLLG